MKYELVYVHRYFDIFPNKEFTVSMNYEIISGIQIFVVIQLQTPFGV